jgi:protein required for attachment to host cells
MKPKRTYILIADGARAHLVLSQGPRKPLTEVAEYQQELAPDRDLQRDRPGRVHESATTVRHTIERNDMHRREKERFACYLAGILDQRLANNECEHIVIAAAPETLGSIRGALSNKVRSVLSGEVPKNLTKFPSQELRAHLPEELWL